MLTSNTNLSCCLTHFWPKYLKISMGSANAMRLWMEGLDGFGDRGRCRCTGVVRGYSLALGGLPPVACAEAHCSAACVPTACWDSPTRRRARGCSLTSRFSRSHQSGDGQTMFCVTTGRTPSFPLSHITPASVFATYSQINNFNFQPEFISQASPTMWKRKERCWNEGPTRAVTRCFLGNRIQATSFVLN